NRFIPFNKIKKISMSHFLMYPTFKMHIEGEAPESLNVFFKGSSHILNKTLQFNPSLVDAQQALNYTHWALVTENFSQRILEMKSSKKSLAVRYLVFPLLLMMMFSV